ncbi:hypothetical protein AK812_SmicGene46039, partial [Symbiodinium microadriaticum]
HNSPCREARALCALQRRVQVPTACHADRGDAPGDRSHAGEQVLAGAAALKERNHRP